MKVLIKVTGDVNKVFGDVRVGPVTDEENSGADSCYG